MEWNPAKQGTVVMGSIVWVWMGGSHLEPSYEEPEVPKATAERASQFAGWPRARRELVTNLETL